MARIRTIKPEFFTSEDICAMSPLARLFFQACWCEADKEGRLEWKPRTMKLRYFPADNCDIEEIAAEVTGQRLVIVYEVDGKKYGEIPSFKRHQHINPRESDSAIPARQSSSARVTTRHGASIPELTDREEGKGRERKEDSEPNGSVGEPTPPANLIELKSAIFRQGLQSLVENNIPESQARSMIGKWRKDAGDGVVIDVLSEAKAKEITDFIPWVTKAIQARASPRILPPQRRAPRQQGDIV